MYLAVGETSSIINPTNYPLMQNVGTLADLINLIVPLATIGAVLIFGAMLLSMAYKILSAGDDAEQVEKAKATATYAILGLILILAAFLIMKILEFALGIDLPL
jgi:hypothetical protein